MLWMLTWLVKNYDIVHTVFSGCAPTCFPQHKRHYPPWFASEIIKVICLKSKMFKKYIRNLKLLFQYIQMRSTSIQNYLDHLSKGNTWIPGLLFKDQEIYIPQDIFNCFGVFFTVLLLYPIVNLESIFYPTSVSQSHTYFYIIFNLILQTSGFPELWKIAVLKKGNINGIANYRPISLIH